MLRKKYFYKDRLFYAMLPALVNLCCLLVSLCRGLKSKLTWPILICFCSELNDIRNIQLLAIDYYYYNQLFTSVTKVFRQISLMTAKVVKLIMYITDVSL